MGEMETSKAVLAGAVIISLSILYTGGALSKLGVTGYQPQTDSPTASSAPVTEKNHKDKLTALAATLGLDNNKFKQCLDSTKYDAEVAGDIASAQEAGVNGTPGFIIGKAVNGTVDGVRIAGAYPYEVFTQVFDKLASGMAPAEVINSLDQTVRQGVTAAKAVVDDDPVLGNPSAVLTMIEFSDYECPFCKRHFTEVHPKIKQNYIDTNKVKLVFRDFIAVPSHNPAATLEAVAANCAREQGGDAAYYKFHDQIYTKTTANGDGI